MRTSTGLTEILGSRLMCRLTRLVQDVIATGHTCLALQRKKRERHDLRLIAFSR
jgi:hypothetical protein